MNQHAVEALMSRYYSVFAPGVPVADTLRDVVADDWLNASSAGQASPLEEFAANVEGLKLAVPDLSWEVAEVVLAGDRVTVRGEGSGTPTSELFGVPASGRPFRILSIDLHTVADGRISSSFHLEDWAGALRQLAG